MFVLVVYEFRDVDFQLFVNFLLFGSNRQDKAIAAAGLGWPAAVTFLTSLESSDK